MNPIAVLVIMAVVAIVYLLLKHRSQISAETAVAHLKAGALVIDVRSPNEFKNGHLPNAINLPLEKLEAALPSRFADKNQVLLLHCQSGMRSGVARTKLIRLGYANTFNLGSYTRAARIVNAK